MEKIYIYMADGPNAPYSELELSESPTRLREGLSLYAVAESPEIGALYAKLTERLGWRSTPLPDGDSRSPAVIYDELLLAARSIPRAAYALRRIVRDRPGFVETVTRSTAEGELVTSA